MRNNHGGARKGAGKPALYDKPMKRREVMLPDEAVDFFLTLGKGNLSAGIRVAWEFASASLPSAEDRLRRIWTDLKIPPEKQDELLAEIDAKAG